MLVSTVLSILFLTILASGSAISGIGTVVTIAIAIIGFGVGVYGSYVALKGKRSQVLSDQQDKANNALTAELAASTAANQRMTLEFQHVQELLAEKGRQMEDKQRQIDELYKRLEQKADVAAVGDKVDLALNTLGQIAQKIGVINPQ